MKAADIAGMQYAAALTSIDRAPYPYPCPQCGSERVLRKVLLSEGVECCDCDYETDDEGKDGTAGGECE